MYEAMEIPKQLQDKLAQYQNLQNQLQMVAMQRQQLQLQSTDVMNAKKELEKLSDGSKVYRMTGPMFFATTREDGMAYLSQEAEGASAKSSLLEKQEKKLAQKLNDMRQEINSMMQPPKGGT